MGLFTKIRGALGLASDDSGLGSFEGVPSPFPGYTPGPTKAPGADDPITSPPVGPPMRYGAPPSPASPADWQHDPGNPAEDCGMRGDTPPPTKMPAQTPSEKRDGVADIADTLRRLGSPEDVIRRTTGGGQ